MIDLSRSRKKPFAHQVVGAEKLVEHIDPGTGRVYPGCLLLADEMRLGKTKQVIDAAQVLFENQEIDVVIVICPAPVRDVWFDNEFGEIQKHRWEGLPTAVTEYHARVRQWGRDYSLSTATRVLRWVVTNYEYVRQGVKRCNRGWSGPKVEDLLKVCGPNTLLVLDESSAVAHYDSLQTRACSALRAKCGRVVLLNGTPIGESPEDLFSQFKIMDKRIIDLDHVSQFRARYAIMGGFMAEIFRYGRRIKVPTEILGWRHEKRDGCCDLPPHAASPVHAPGYNLEELQRRLAPYVVRRLRKDCLDLPPKLDPVSITATLSPETWRVYREMRDEMVARLSENSAAVALQAGVHVMRLSQITSGFVGGILEENSCLNCEGSGYENESSVCKMCNGSGATTIPASPREVGREKLDLFLKWVAQRLKEEPEFRMIAWCRFRPELLRLIDSIREKFPEVRVQAICGGQKKSERLEGLRLMHPDEVYRGPAILVGTLGTGSMGINLAGAHEVVYVSNDYSLMKRQQSEDRPHGPGQTQPVSYHDILAVGPKGERTIDHIVIGALRRKEDVASWTCGAWENILREI